MKAIVIPRFGDPDVLELQERERLVPGPEEVVVRVRAAALNRADLLQRRGRYPAPPGAPADVPGLEFAGEVAAVGARVFGLAPGARVMGILGGGGHATEVATHERLCLEVPERLSWEEAGAVPEAFLTAFDALVLQCGLAAGETVYVPALASGVGLAAAQIAAACGARVVGSTRSAEKKRRLEEMGIGTVLDGTAPDLADQVRAAAPRGADVVLDLVGAAAFPLHMEILAPRGRIVFVGTMAGHKAELNLSVVMGKRLRLFGTVLRARPLEEKIAVTQTFRARMLPLLAEGRLKPLVDSVFPFARAAEAHALMEKNANMGKIVLVP
ncbi:NAD(P)H-quinone oxidoreductase [bacterium]|nr:NAD(P)H-quinone oxidoreductase [bacterium]